MTPDEILTQQQALIAAQQKQIETLLGQAAPKPPPPLEQRTSHTEKFAKNANELMTVVLIGIIIIVIIGTLLAIKAEM